jgi:hypothetical protein
MNETSRSSRQAPAPADPRGAGDDAELVARIARQDFAYACMLHPTMKATLRVE